MMENKEAIVSSALKALDLYLWTDEKHTLAGFAEQEGIDLGLEHPSWKEEVLGYED
jgi:hypothetical protein